MTANHLDTIPMDTHSGTQQPDLLLQNSICLLYYVMWFGLALLSLACSSVLLLHITEKPPKILCKSTKINCCTVCRQRFCGELKNTTANTRYESIKSKPSGCGTRYTWGIKSKNLVPSLLNISAVVVEGWVVSTWFLERFWLVSISPLSPPLSIPNLISLHNLGEWAFLHCKECCG